MFHPLRVPRVPRCVALAVFTGAVAAALSLSPQPGAAQDKAQPECQLGCITYSVLVDPHGGTYGGTVVQPANGGPYTATFTVTNTSSPDGVTDTYAFTCSASGGISCISVSPTSATLSSGAAAPISPGGGGGGAKSLGTWRSSTVLTYPTSVDVQVTYTVGATGGNVYLTATGLLCERPGVVYRPAADVFGRGDP